MNEEKKVTEKKNIVKRIWPILAILLIAIILSVIPISHALSANSLKKQISLGQKYLEELDYEQAAASFLAVIEIDDRNVEAYLGLAEAYRGLGQTDEAISILEKGISLTDDESLKAYLQEIEDELAAAEAARLAQEEAQKEVVDGEAVENEDENTWASVILEYRDGSFSEPITDIPMFYILSEEGASTFYDFASTEHDQSQWSRLRDEALAPYMVCPLCEYSPCVFLDGILRTYMNVDDPELDTYTNTRAILMYCPECKEVSSIGYMDALVPYDPVTKGPAYY